MNVNGKVNLYGENSLKARVPYMNLHNAVLHINEKLQKIIDIDDKLQKIIDILSNLKQQ